MRPRAQCSEENDPLWLAVDYPASPNALKANWPFCNELAVEDGIAMKSYCIIIPTLLQKEILTKLHATHQGTEKTKLRARLSEYWKGPNKDIDEITKTM